MHYKTGEFRLYYCYKIQNENFFYGTPWKSKFSSKFGCKIPVAK